MKLRCPLSSNHVHTLYGGQGGPLEEGGTKYSEFSIDFPLSIYSLAEGVTLSIYTCKLEE